MEKSCARASASAAESGKTHRKRKRSHLALNMTDCVQRCAGLSPQPSGRASRQACASAAAVAGRPGGDGCRVVALQLLDRRHVERVETAHLATQAQVEAVELGELRSDLRVQTELIEVPSRRYESPTHLCRS